MRTRFYVISRVAEGTDSPVMTDPGCLCFDNTYFCNCTPRQ